ncbi:hypothetical protein F4775DRAFT_539163 [Biscogniauxia sp. FL1348]|nr:hypothetical protein F4775DRAFT_539163 [Biscogniauxia sp. FL1348]
MSHPPPPSLAQRQFSPPQPSPSPSAPTPTFTLPPSKRAKISPGPSQPASPYPNSYAASPTATTPGAATPITGLASPALPTTTIPTIPPAVQPPPSLYNPPQQTNGRPPSSGMTLTMPSAAPTPTLPSPQPQTPNATQAPYSSATLAPVSAAATSAISNMGPPTTTASFSAANDAAKQPAKSAPSKAVAYDMDDMLVGTGIDLDEEAEIMNNMESRGGFGNYPPGGRDSFYGAGPANQPPQHSEAKSQEDLAAEAADRAWNESAHRLAVTRSHEIAHHLLEPGMVHKRLYDISSKFGLALNLDLKPDGKSLYMGRFAQPADFPKPEIKVLMQKAPDGTVVQTLGSFIPKESFLVDQIALLSIATKEHIRELLSDANRIATTRQQTSHGIIPAEWADAAAYPSPKANGTHDEGQRTGAESAVSPRTNPLKRSADELSNGLPTPVSESPPVNSMVEAMLGGGKNVQNAEEGRLRKRQKRADKASEKDKDNAEGGSRTGSVAPGTPGSVAPESSEAKAPTKKEGKKAAAKAAEASSSTQVNTTLSLFAGGKKKKYSWMSAAAAGSGASSPRPQAGGPGTPGGAAGAGGRAGRGPLTKGSVAHLGQFREDSAKGKNIQLRDWVVVLEERGFDQKTLQEAYNRIDKSDTGDRVATEKSP